MEQKIIDKGLDTRFWNDYNGESTNDIMKRASDFIQTELIKYWNENKGNESLNVLIVSHQGFLTEFRNAMEVINNYNFNPIDYDIGNCSISEY